METKYVCHLIINGVSNSSDKLFKSKESAYEWGASVISKDYKIKDSTMFKKFIDVRNDKCKHVNSSEVEFDGKHYTITQMRSMLTPTERLIKHVTTVPKDKFVSINDFTVSTDGSIKITGRLLMDEDIIGCLSSDIKVYVLPVKCEKVVATEPDEKKKPRKKKRKVEEIEKPVEEEVK